MLPQKKDRHRRKLLLFYFISFYFTLFYFIKLRYKSRVTTTACANYCGPVTLRYVDFTLVREENRSTCKKTLEAQERSTTGTQIT